MLLRFCCTICIQFVLSFFSTAELFAQSAAVGKNKHLIYHDIRTDKTGKILPWYDDDPAVSYDHILHSVWTYWKNVPGHWPRGRTRGEGSAEWRKELPFPPKYLIFRTFEDKGVGGDQFAMMLSSFDLYYNYTGNEEVIQNMEFQANWYLKYGLSKSTDAWPDIPYPCNTTEAPVYDGDLLLGKGFTQPDKAGSFGAELVMLFKKTGKQQYLDAAVKIANTLADHTQVGDYDHSPLPFKVHAVTGDIKTGYCSNWTGTMRLFTELTDMHKGSADKYLAAYKKLNDWILQYPVKNNRWGPFFEDINSWSDTEINEGTFAWHLLTHRDQYPDWKNQVRYIQNWAIDTLGIHHWDHLGCTVMGEQSVYKMQGQSHTSRHASIELMYAQLTGDLSRKEEAVRQLNFATYAVDHDGKNRWMNFATYEIWWTDGYGDFMRHYLRSMEAFPELAPAAQNHLLSSSSVIQKITYKGNKEADASAADVQYITFDPSGEEKIRLTKKPSRVMLEQKALQSVETGGNEGFRWTPLQKGGWLTITRKNGRQVSVTL